MTAYWWDAIFFLYGVLAGGLVVFFALRERIDPYLAAEVRTFLALIDKEEGDEHGAVEVSCQSVFAAKLMTTTLNKMKKLSGYEGVRDE